MVDSAPPPTIEECAQLADALRRYLEEHGKTQSQFASLAEVGQPQVSRLLDGKIDRMRRATFDKIQAAIPASFRVRPVITKPVTGPSMYTVFLSSTYLDNAVRRERIVDVIERLGMRAIAMERFTASNSPAVEFCIREAASANVYVGILTWRYGWIPPGEKKSITELEYEAASEVERLVFTIGESKVDLKQDVDTLANNQLDFEKFQRLQAFKNRAGSEAMSTPFKDDMDLIVKVQHALHDWLNRQRDAHDTGTKSKKLTKPSLPSEFDLTVARYLDAVGKANESLRVVGFDTKMTVPIRIEDLCVELHANIDLRPVRRGSAANFKHADEMIGEARCQDLKLIDLFRRRAEFGNPKSFAILGEPGSGKTTHLRRLVYAIVRGGPESLGLDPDTIPLFLPLRLLSDERDLFDFARRQVTEVFPDADEAFLDELLSHRKLLLLCDGLDEVPAKRRGTIRRWIAAAAKKPNVTIVTTCRYAGYRDDATFDGDFLELHLRPLTDAEAEQFVKNWFELVETTYAPDLDAAKKKARQDAEKLIAKLRSPDFRTSRIYEFTKNPLLLTAICLIQRDREIPERRIEIYEECVRALLQLWRESAGLKIKFKADEAQAVLQKVALALHERGEVLAPADILAPVIDPALAETKRKGVDAAQFLATIRDESGLLTGWSHDRFGFMHLGFQEYLTALELRERILAAKDPKVRLARVQEITQHFGKSWWQEVLLLMLAARGAPLFEELFDEIVKLDAFAQHSQLVDYCLADALKISYSPFESVLESAKKKHAKKLDAIGQAAARVLRAKAPELWEKYAKHFEAGMASTAAVFRVSEAEIEFVNIPGGSFWMGADPKIDGDEEWMQRSMPLHHVTLAPFAMSRAPITNAQYKLFLEANPKLAAPKYWSDRQYNQPEQPVVGVSWDDAMAFCEWAKVKLPTEAQWEYACRAQIDADKSARTRFWCGDENKLADVAWYDKNSEGRLHAVAEKPANAFGLHDMHGNVWEWCEDYWANKYPADESTDPVGPTGDSSRVIRGGSLGDNPNGCRSACRVGSHPGDRGDDLGFRVVLPTPTP